jgi:hypothetical protein
MDTRTIIYRKSVNLLQFRITGGGKRQQEVIARASIVVPPSDNHPKRKTITT